MLNTLKEILYYAIDYSAKIKTYRNPNIKISDTAKISAYRKLFLKEGSYLNIGDDTLMQGSIFIECSNSSVAIGSRTFIGGSILMSASKIIIGDDVLISWGCTIIDHDSHAISWSKRSTDVLDWAKGEKNWQHVHKGEIHIHNKAWIGANVTILKNVSIGEGAVIGAGSVVTKNIPAWTIAAGNPAKIIRMIAENER